jgi:hypothetical protein
MLVVDRVSGPTCTNITHSSLIMDCRELLPQVKVKHCFRETNQCTDILVRIGTTLQLDFIICDSSPIKLFLHFFSLIQLVCMYYGRLCPNIDSVF